MNMATGMKTAIVFAVVTIWVMSADPIHSQSTTPEHAVFEMAEVSDIPSFPGGKRALKEFVSENLEYPEVAREHHVEGTVWVEFVVATDGSLTDIKVRKNIGFGCKTAAIDLVKEMPLWSPGMIGKAAVRTKVILPIPFYKSDVRI